MTLHLSGRGVAVSAVLRRRVEGKIAKVSRVLPKITEARVVLGRERYRHLAEVTLAAKGAMLRAEAAADDFHAALDLALAHLEAQARRRKDRVTTRKPRAVRDRTPAGEFREPSEAPDETPSPDVRRIRATPMSVDEALDQVALRADGLLVFTNARTRVVNLLHRRPDGTLELVEPSG